MTCRKLKSEISTTELVSSKIVYDDIFADTKKKKGIIDILSKLIEARLEILKEEQAGMSSAQPQAEAVSQKFRLVFTTLKVNSLLLSFKI
jgi:hypothetical protein